MSPTSVIAASTALFESLVAKGVFPITNTYSRYIVGTSSVVTFLAMRGVGVVAIALRRHTGFDMKFDHCFRYARFFELHRKPCIPDACRKFNIKIVFAMFYLFFFYYFSFWILNVPSGSTIFSSRCNLSSQINWAPNLRLFIETQLIFVSF